MPTANKKKARRKTTVRGLNRQISGLRARVEDLEDLRDLNAAVARNGGKPGIPWEKAKVRLGLA